MLHKKLLNHLLRLLPMILAMILLICYAIIPDVYLFIRRYSLHAVILVLGTCTIGFYRHFFINLVIYCIVLWGLFHSINLRPSVVKEIDGNDYYLSTAVNTSTFHGYAYVGVSAKVLNQYSSLQNGGLSTRVVTYEKKNKYSDTVILKMAYRFPKYMEVYDDKPSHEEIQKYMEPVLYHNGKEQPRPKYSEWDFSNDERRLYMYLSHPQIVKVVSKQKDEFLRNLVTLKINDTTQITVNLMYKDVMSYIDENDLDKVFNSIDVNGRGVIAKVSNINPRVVEVTKWNPTETDYAIAFDKKTQVDTALEKELMAKSVKQLGYIINKHKEESWTSRHKKKVDYYATVCVNDTINRTFEIKGKDNYAIYNSIEQGDAVLVRVSEIYPYAVRMLNWHPTNAETE